VKDTSLVEILIVEDSAQDLELALTALAEAKFANRVQVARDGEEALDFVFGTGSRADRDVADAPAVIFLDLKLPKVDGLEVLRRVKADARTKTIPVVVLTSSKEQRDVLESYQLGVNSYIVKPVNFEQFVAAIQDVARYWLRLNQRPLVVT
jgi:two-component system, response regulator